MSFLPVVVPRLQAQVLEWPIVKANQRVSALLSHPAGPFTIHFWAPSFKWGISIAKCVRGGGVQKTHRDRSSAMPPSHLVPCTKLTPRTRAAHRAFRPLRPALAGSRPPNSIADMRKDPRLLSTPQQTAVAATGLIWSRYSTQIVPVNYNLLSVNIFMAATGLYQLYRIAT